MDFPFSQLFDLGFGAGVGAGLVIAPLMCAFAVWDSWSERRSKARRASRRRPPSISGNTEPLPVVREGDIIKWGKHDHRAP